MDCGCCMCHGRGASDGVRDMTSARDYARAVNPSGDLHAMNKRRKERMRRYTVQAHPMYGSGTHCVCYDNRVISYHISEPNAQEARNKLINK